MKFGVMNAVEKGRPRGIGPVSMMDPRATIYKHAQELKRFLLNNGKMQGRRLDFLVIEVQINFTVYETFDQILPVGFNSQFQNSKTII